MTVTLPTPGSVVVIEATRPDGLPSLQKATLVGNDDTRLGLHLRAGALTDLRLGPGSLLRLHWSEPAEVHGSTTALVATADAQVGTEAVVDGVVMAHLSAPDDDRRTHSRVRVPGTVVWDGGEGSLLDVSAGGLRIETADRIDGPVSMVIHVGGRDLAVVAEPVGQAGTDVRLILQSSAIEDLSDVVSSLVAALTLDPV